MFDLLVVCVGLRAFTGHARAWVKNIGWATAAAREELEGKLRGEDAELRPLCVGVLGISRCKRHPTTSILHTTIPCHM